MNIVSSRCVRTVVGNGSTYLQFFLTLCIFSIPAASQVVQIVDKNLPSVYLKYEDETSSVRKPSSVVLKLFNNTSLSINLAANFSTKAAQEIEDGSIELPDGAFGTYLKSGSEVELCYGAEGLFIQKDYSQPKKMANPEVTDLRNSCSYRSNGKRVDDPYSMGYWIRPKGYVRFSVPASLLDENIKAYTEYRYVWEFENGRIKYNEPRHRVYFFSADLPKRDKE